MTLRDILEIMNNRNWKHNPTTPSDDLATTICRNRSMAMSPAGTSTEITLAHFFATMHGIPTCSISFFFYVSTMNPKTFTTFLLRGGLCRQPCCFIYSHLEFFFLIFFLIFDFNFFFNFSKINFQKTKQNKTFLSSLL